MGTCVHDEHYTSTVYCIQYLLFCRPEGQKTVSPGHIGAKNRYALGTNKYTCVTSTLIGQTHITAAPASVR